MLTVSAGAGKSFLTLPFCPGLRSFVRSIAIDYLHSSESITKIRPLYLFFDYKDVDNQTAKKVIRSLLKQLVLARQSIPSDLEKIYNEDKDEKRSPTLDTFVNLFIKHVNELSFIVLLDAFDECGEQENVLSRLIQHFYNSGIKMFITHRPHALTTPELHFQNFASVEIQARDEDVERFITEELDTKPKGKRLDADFRDRISTEIKNKAKGMYRCM